MLESGMIRAKNSINVAVKNLLDFAISMLMFAAFGFSLMFGATNFGLFGSHVDFSASNNLSAFFLFQMVFCGTAATIVSGAIAERTRLITYMVVVVVLSGFTYPLIGHWCWGGALENTGSGWLAEMGFVDWAGTAVVHLVGGWASLAAIIAIGPRRNYKRGKLTGGHSLTLAIMGCFLLWFGWWGFNGGSGLNADDNVSIVLLNTNLGAVAGLLVAALWSWMRTRKTDVVDLISGALAGLVSVTGSCHAISPFAAIAAGVVGGLIALLSIELLRKWGADDAVGAFGIHGAAGIWGTLVFALFAPLDSLPAGSREMQLWVQSIAVLAVCGFSFITIYGTLRLLKVFTRLRVRAGEEKTGLNVVEHGATNEVTDLLGAMNSHRQTGNFSTQIETDTDTEVGQIASQYNAVIERVNEEVIGHQTTNRFLREEKLRLQSILEHAGVGIYQLDRDGRFQSANPTILEIFGYASASSLIELENGFEIPWHNEQVQVAEYFERGEVVKDLETEFTDHQGQRRWVLENIVPIRDVDGRLVTWLGTVHDITARKLAMLAEVEIAEAKSAAKGEFLANMSHEIRTPLNGVIGMLDLLATTKQDNKEQNYINVARSSADTLLSLINDILDFSKIESGKLELEQVDFDLRELMESTAEQFAIRAHTKGLEMNCRLGTDLPYMVNGDPERLRQVIINLMGNAIKFTESGEINLKVSRRGSVIHFGVEDTGIGIATDAKEKLFESFVQADPSTTRKYGGSGLGLTIVSSLVQLMGGNLKVDSVLGHGSEFWFEIPLQVVEGSDPQEMEHEVLQRLSKCHVLIVDDNSTNCEILENQLACWGMSSKVCQQSTTAVQKMLVAERLGRPFDLVILDFCMPELDGRGVAMQLKQNTELSGVPIIMLSSNHDLLTRDELEEAGISVAMTKPARQSRLFDSIVSAIFHSHRRSNDSAPANVEKETMADAHAQEIQPLEENRAAEESRVVEEGRFSTSNANELAVPIRSAQPNYAADVLIAEDNQVNQIVVQQMLLNLGYTTEVVPNGQRAVERVKAARFGMVLMDGHMPILDGLAASRMIRQWESQQQSTGDSEIQSVPIVALTANVVAGFEQKCIDAGMNDYLCKPISLERLNDATSKYIGQTNKHQPPVTSDLVSDVSVVSTLLTSVESVSAEVGQIASGSLPQIQSRSQNFTGSLKTGSANSTPVRTEPVVVPTNSTVTPLPGNQYFDQESMDIRCSGNQEIQKQLLTIMRETLPERVVELREAISQNDSARVRAIAHQLKGAAGDTSLLAVREAAEKLEDFASGESAQVPMALSELEQRVEGTLQELENFLR